MSGACADCGGPDYQTLEARIAELEALHDKAINRETEAKRERNELRDQLEQAEAELAERDRMLRIAHKTAGGPERSMSYELWLADLRARAEEGSDT